MTYNKLLEIASDGPKSAGQIAHETFHETLGDACGRRRYVNGWSALPDARKSAWEAAAREVMITFTPTGDASVDFETFPLRPVQAGAMADSIFVDGCNKELTRHHDWLQASRGYGAFVCKTIYDNPHVIWPPHLDSRKKDHEPMQEKLIAANNEIKVLRSKLETLERNASNLRMKCDEAEQHMLRDMASLEQERAAVKKAQNVADDQRASADAAKAKLKQSQKVVATLAAVVEDQYAASLVGRCRSRRFNVTCEYRLGMQVVLQINTLGEARDKFCNVGALVDLSFAGGF